MGDQDRRKFISSNLSELTGSTLVGPELVVNLFSKELINDTDRHVLLDSHTPNLNRSIILYTDTANKWNQRQFEDFKRALHETGNLLALQVLTKAGADMVEKNNPVTKSVNSSLHCRGPQVQPILEVIAATENNEGKVKVHSETLQEVFAQEEVKHLPVVVISINGRKRTGKSFMLTQFLKYLSQPNDPDWINKSTCGNFKWMGGSARVTPGIQVWTEPIIIEVGDTDGQMRKVAVILMDCQGLFDSETTMEQNSKLFAFSALLSSIFIFNDNKDLGDDVLGFMHSFLEYAKFTDVSDNTPKKAIFQKLVMLVRDWANDVDNAGYESYKCGYYDDNLMPPGQSSNLKRDTFEGTGECEFTSKASKTRRGILSSFEDVGMYAMAGPGESCTFPNPNESSANNWTLKFRNCVVDFVSHTLSVENLSRSTRRLGGDAEVTGEKLFQMAIQWGKIIMSNDGPRIPASVLDTMIDFYFEEKIDSALAMYCSEMMSALKKFPQGMTSGEFISEDETATNAAVALLGRQDSCMGSPEDFTKFKRKLHDKLLQSRSSFDASNESNIKLEKRRLEVEAAKQDSVQLAQDAVDKAMEELNTANRQLQLVHQNKLEYTSNVEVTKKHRRRVLGIVVSPSVSTHVEAQFDNAKYERAVADASRVIEERQQQVREAQVRLEGAKQA